MVGFFLFENGKLFKPYEERARNIERLKVEEEIDWNEGGCIWGELEKLDWEPKLLKYRVWRFV